MTIKIPSLLFLLLMMLTTHSTYSALLTAGDSALLPGTTVAAQPELAGTILHDEQISDTVLLPDATTFLGATINNRVVRSATTNNLIFSPRISTPFNITLDDYVIDSAQLSGFSDFELDVNYRTDEDGDRGPNQATRSADGDTLTFDFLFPLFVGNLVGEPQEQSYFFTISTDATDFSLDGRMLIHLRHLSTPVQNLTLSYENIAVPVRVAQVNSPETLSLMMIGLFGLLLLKRQQG